MALGLMEHNSDMPPFLLCHHQHDQQHQHRLGDILLITEIQRLFAKGRKAPLWNPESCRINSEFSATSYTTAGTAVVRTWPEQGKVKQVQFSGNSGGQCSLTVERIIDGHGPRSGRIYKEDLWSEQQNGDICLQASRRAITWYLRWPSYPQSAARRQRNCTQYQRVCPLKETRMR